MKLIEMNGTLYKVSAIEWVGAIWERSYTTAKYVFAFGKLGDGEDCMQAYSDDKTQLEDMRTILISRMEQDND